MLIDCDTCTGQGVHCGDCVIAVLLDSPPAAARGLPPEPARRRYELDSDEQIAFVALADAGLLPPLRLVPKPHVAASRDTRGIA